MNQSVRDSKLGSQIMCQGVGGWVGGCGDHKVIDMYNDN